MTTIPPEVMKEIENMSAAFANENGCRLIPGRIDGKKFSKPDETLKWGLENGFYEGSQFGYSLAQKQAPPIPTGRDFWICVGPSPYYNVFEKEPVEFQKEETIHVREVTPKDEAREKAVKGLVEALNNYHKAVHWYETIPEKLHKALVKGNKALAAWEKANE